MNDYEIGVTSDPHTKADLRERFLPVSWKLSFLCVEPSIFSGKVKSILIGPQNGIIGKRVLGPEHPGETNER